MLSKITKIRLILAIALPALLAIFAAPAYAGQAIGVAPALVSVKVNKAVEKKYPLIIFNEGAKPMRVDVEFLDFELSPDGHVIFLHKRKTNRPWSAASWLELSQKTFVLHPNEEKKIWLRISAPKKVEPGTHRALVRFGTTSSIFGKDNKSRLLVKAHVSAVVLVNVAGRTSTKPTVGFDIPKINFSDPTADLTLGNTGNAHYFANGKVSFLSNGKTEPTEFRLKRKPPGAMVLPKAKRIFTFSWRKAPYFGFFTGVAEIKITGGRILRAERNFFIIRWQLLLAVFSLIALILLTYVGAKNFKIVKRTD